MDQKEKALEEEPEMDPEVAAMVGFGGFTFFDCLYHLFLVVLR